MFNHMVEQLPVVGDVEEGGDFPKQAKQLFAKLAQMVNGFTGDRNRARGLVLFEEREHNKDIKRPLSKVMNNDLPQTELILYHRNEVRRLETTITSIRGFLEESIAKKRLEGLLDCMQELTKWEAQRLKHLQMLEDLLEKWNDELAGKEANCAKLGVALATLSQKADEHRDKMELANKAAAIPTTAELKQRLALKYGVPVEQVEAILAAKQVEAEAGDG
jgi:septal ring factor EnvC (AmiA/AmiB activator)